MGISESSADTEAIIKGLTSASIEPTFPAASKESASVRRHELDRWYTVSFSEETSLEEVARILAANEMVSAVQYNSLIEGTDTDTSIEYDPVALTKAGTSSLPFNDPSLGIQWNMINTGDKSISATAVEGADVGVKDAWRLTAGDPRVIVAVFDQGISTIHPDLEDALWVNTAEVNGKDGVDDDGNGYIDDKHGYNFADNKGKPSAKYGADHGTHIAGTIAATNNNGIGVSSIAGGSGCGDGVRLMSCQIFNENGGKTSSSKIAKAFQYAADHGACVAQCSYGESTENILSDDEYRSAHTVEYDALQYFLDPENANCEALETNIAVFASGNYNNPASLYPGALKECISVTAICPDLLPGGYSNYGAGCDIAAPGGDIIKNESEAPCMILSTGIGKNGQATYIYKYGTSMACPHVSGVVALGMSYALKIGKRFSRQDFISRLLTSAQDIDAALTGSTMKLRVDGSSYVETDVYPKKKKMGTGTVNAWNFLMALEGTPTFIAQTGKEISIDLADCIGETYGNFEYGVSIDEASKASLGIVNTPAITGGTMKLICTKNGAGKIRLTSSVGGQEQIPGLDFFVEISIVSRTNVASNGGWL